MPKDVRFVPASNVAEAVSRAMETPLTTESQGLFSFVRFLAGLQRSQPHCGMCCVFVLCLCCVVCFFSLQSVLECVLLLSLISFLGAGFHLCAYYPEETKQLPPLFDCSGCGRMRYCSVECQKLHWPTHKHFCKKPRTKS